MNPIIKKDILNVLRQTIDIVKKNNLYKLREVSDHVIHNAAIFQDQYSITIAVTIYSMSKIYKDKVDSFILPHLQNAVNFLELGKLNSYEEEIKKIIKDISKKNNKTKYYMQEVLERAQIKKASKIYEHGISLGQVADALGVSMWELMDYVGKTRIVDKFNYQTDIKQKLEFTRGLFR